MPFREKMRVCKIKILAYTSCLFYRRTDDSEYNAIFCQLIKGVIERCSGGEREELLRRLYLESPIITEDAIDILKQFVTMREQTTAITGVTNIPQSVLLHPFLLSWHRKSL